MAGPPPPVGLDRARVLDGRALGLQQLHRLAPEARGRLEEGAVGLLGRMSEAPVKTVQQDRGSAFHQRKRVAPHPQGKAKREIGGEQRVRRFARQERRGAGDPDHDRVELSLEWCRTRLDAAEQCLGVRDRRRAAVGCGEGELAPQRTDDPVASPARQQPERPPQRGARDSVQCLLFVRVAAGGAAEAGVVERQRSADHGYPPRQLALDRDAKLPSLRGAGLQQGVGACGAERLAARRAQ